MSDDDENNVVNSTGSQNSSDLNIVKYDSPSFKFNVTTSPSLIINNISFFNNFTTNFFKELLQELYIILINTEVKEQYSNYNIEDKLKEFTSNFLFEYDLDPKNVLEIMTNNSPNICYYSSLIGFFYQHGIGCKVDKAKAFETLSNAVENNQRVESSFDEGVTFRDDDIKRLNEIILQYFYSLLLYKDVIIKDNYKLHIKNAEKGDPISQYYIGNCYHSGQKDCNKAVEWYSKSSEGGNVKAMYMLGSYIYGIMKDKKKAFELYLKSAEGGYKSASYMVGCCYYYGDGILKDQHKAFEWYLRAAKKGDGYSQYLVADYYNDGNYIQKDEEKGFYWNRKGAINGNWDAQYELAKYYLNNSNEKKAFQWYLKLANKYSKAKYFLAKCYRDGIGTDKNLDEATKWFEKYETSKYYKKPLITLDDFLNGSNINVSEIRI